MRLVKPGGWPLTMFLTPAGEPFWGGTYFPKEPRYGRPAFTSVLRTVADAYRNEPDKIAYQLAPDRREFAREFGPDAEGARHDQPRLPRQAGDADPGRIDRYCKGGLQGAPKFPNTPIFEFLWRRPGEACREPSFGPRRG